MFVTQFNSATVAQYMYENRKNIPIIDTVMINDFLYGRLDIIVNKYYPDHMEYLPLIMDFNNITDPTNLNIGTLIDVPDIDYLLNNMELMEDETKIPGVLSSMRCDEINIAQQNNTSKTKTTALPKLNITLRKVSYDSDSGVITY